MGKIAGVKLEKDTLGRVRKVTLDMKYHAAFVEDYLDRLKIKERQQDASFTDWEKIKSSLDKKHGIVKKTVQSSRGTQSRKTA